MKKLVTVSVVGGDGIRRWAFVQGIVGQDGKVRVASDVVKAMLGSYPDGNTYTIGG